MVTIEVELKEDDPEPEQHLDEGEHIERLIVPLSELHDKLKGKRVCPSLNVSAQRPTNTRSDFQRERKDRRCQVSVS